LHLTVARTINEHFPLVKETHPEVLAHHWTGAGQVEAAVSEWSRAGKYAEARGAFIEALESYQQALTLLCAFPTTRDRDHRELALCQSVVAMLNVIKGYAAPETINAVQRAITLAEKNGDLNQLVNLLTTQGGAFLVSGDFSNAAATFDRAQQLAMKQRNPGNLAYVHGQQTMVHYWRGDLRVAEEHFQSWQELFRHGETEGPVLGTSLNPALNALAFGSYVAWISGRANVARAREAELIALANRGSLFEKANAGYLTLALFLREYRQAEALAERTIQLAEKHHLPNPAARSRTVLGLALAHLGRAEEGVASSERGITDLRKIGTRMGITQTMARLAEAQGLAGRIREALESLEISLQILPEEIIFRPEILRLRGELRLKQQQSDAAENDFRDSIGFAREMSAKAWELRSTTSLARLLSHTGHRDEARSILAEIYDSFTEGFDTADLKDAKVLLDELSR
jgi:tetratricopeptide (TPR) repeat protein